MGDNIIRFFLSFTNYNQGPSHIDQCCFFQFVSCFEHSPILFLASRYAWLTASYVMQAPLPPRPLQHIQHVLAQTAIQYMLYFARETLLLCSFVIDIQLNKACPQRHVIYRLRLSHFFIYKDENGNQFYFGLSLIVNKRYESHCRRLEVNFYLLPHFNKDFWGNWFSICLQLWFVAIIIKWSIVEIFHCTRVF